MTDSCDIEPKFFNRQNSRRKTFLSLNWTEVELRKRFWIFEFSVNIPEFRRSKLCQSAFHRRNRRCRYRILVSILALLSPLVAKPAMIDSQSNGNALVPGSNTQLSTQANALVELVLAAAVRVAVVVVVRVSIKSATLAPLSNIHDSPFFPFFSPRILAIAPSKMFVHVKHSYSRCECVCVCTLRAESGQDCQTKENAWSEWNRVKKLNFLNIFFQEYLGAISLEMEQTFFQVER